MELPIYCRTSPIMLISFFSFAILTYMLVFFFFFLTQLWFYLFLLYNNIFIYIYIYIYIRGMRVNLYNLHFPSFSISPIFHPPN